MDELIKLENIKTNVEASDWRDAIRKAGELLEKAGSIKSDYIEGMIKSVEELGPYIVLMPGFALGHDAPSPSVLKNDLSLITLTNPVDFGSTNDPVRVVMCLACTDPKSHMEGIQKVALKLMQDSAIDNMMACKTEKDLYNFLNAE